MNHNRQATKHREISETPPEEQVTRRAVPGIVEGALMAEIVADRNGQLQFAVAHSAALQDEVRLRNGAEILAPPRALKAFVEVGALQLPSRAERGIRTDVLLGEIMECEYTWAAMPDDWLEPIANYVLMTWMYDQFTAVPYLRFLGEYGTGKTRILQVVSALCYRSLGLSGNVTGAALFRSIDLVRGTLAIDEADLKTSAEWSDIVKVLNNGYTPRLPVIRCDGLNRPEPFRVYGPKIISTRHRFDDPALESRCITFETQERTIDPRIPLQLAPEFYEGTWKLRNKLLGWRFDNFRSIEADDSKLRHLDSRIAQVGASLLAVAPYKDAMVGFLNSYAQNTKDDSPREVVRQILSETTGRLSVAQVTNTANRRLQGSGMSELTHKAVGSIVRSLGHKTKRRNTGYVIER